MKAIYIAVLSIFSFSMVGNAQTILKQDFEKLQNGEDILNLSSGKFSTWGESTWTVTEQVGKGFENSNKYATSGGEENATLAQYRDLEVGETYEFSVAVKMDGTGGANWKGNYSVIASTGDKNKTHFYGKEEVKEPAEGKWQLHKIKFKVKKKKTSVCFRVYRWKPDVKISVDNFKIEKI